MSDCTGKQSTAEDANVDDKKMKLEIVVSEEKASMPAATNSAEPKFINVIKLPVPIAELTDEELLEYALEFERKHEI